ncbi:hypothetical protein P171DRAFT_427760 [Karstenula rhodostoma CBS 690.94]|uniref:Uncharacterized protein n=1 Tax=Karstenula rhodostoma CBS 690.94 TaxID=1392251 RepID=A0A9P4PVK0_9PLEO|nr:hypothetical protein P171DRAFT_427760 [Karstenula rhodostoma CBS 690.94]
MSAPQRPVYTPAQIANYFDRLKLPEEQPKYHVSRLDPEHALEYLALLQKLHLAEIPFEKPVSALFATPPDIYPPRTVVRQHHCRLSSWRRSCLAKMGA